MAIPPSLKPRPHKLKKGETIPKVLRREGFGPGEIRPIMNLKGNKPLIKKFGSVDDVPEGEIFYIPVLSEKQAISLWDTMGSISAIAGQAKENVLYKALTDARRDVRKLQERIRNIWRYSTPDVQNIRRTKDKCLKDLPRGMKSKDIDTCMVAIEKYLQERKRLDHALENLASKLDAELVQAEQYLSMLEKLVPPSMAALEGLRKVAGTMQKSANEMRGQFK